VQAAVNVGCVLLQCNIKIPAGVTFSRSAAIRYIPAEADL